MSLLVLLASVGCGGSGDDREALTVDAYFQEVQAADDVASARFEQIGSQLDPSLPEAEALEALQSALPQQVATLRDLAERFDALAPPPGLEDVHEAAVEALERNVEVNEGDSAEIQSATSMTAAVAALDDEESNDAARETQETCLALERAGAERGITVDLDC